jgi:glycosyltransferase involved in cell wall biosynthesis
VVVTNAGQPRRGLETLLDAAAAIARRHPGLEIEVAGGVSDRSGYGRLLRRRIDRLAFAGRVRLLGFQDAPSLARLLAGAHAYVMPSFAENSSNSLCEAQTVGIPCVAAAAGGTPSLVDDGRTGLLYPAGDAEALAAQVTRVLGDDLLATRLGSAGRGEALLRHARRRVVGELLSAYRSILGHTVEDDGVMEGMGMPA